MLFLLVITFLLVMNMLHIEFNFTKIIQIKLMKQLKFGQNWFSSARSINDKKQKNTRTEIINYKLKKKN